MRKRLGIFAVITICIGILSINAAAQNENTAIAGFSVETGECIVDSSKNSITLYATYTAPNVPEILQDTACRICVNIYTSPTDARTYKGECVEVIKETANNKKVTFELQPEYLCDHELIPGETYYYKAHIIDIKNDITICEGDFKSFVAPGQINEIKLGSPGLVKSEHAGLPCQWYSFTAPDTDTYMLDFDGEGILTTYSQSKNGRLERKSSTVISNDGKWMTFLMEKDERLLIALCHYGKTDSFLTIDRVNVDVTLDANGGTWKSGDNQTHLFIQDSEFNTSGEITSYTNGVCVLGEYRDDVNKDGAHLIGWSTAADGTGAFYGVEDFVLSDDNNIRANKLTLYAQWYERQSETSTIFVPCGGSFENGTTTPRECIDGIAPAAYREDYQLIGWVDRCCASHNIMYFPGDSIDPATDVLYACWLDEDSKDCVVIFDFVEDVQSISTGEAIKREKAVKSYSGSTYVFFENYEKNICRPGYILTGWNTSADKSGTHYECNATIRVQKEFGRGTITHLYAEWEKIDLPDNYYVFIPGEGTFSDGSAYKVVNRTEKFKFPQIEYDDYLLVGWHNRSEGMSIVDYNIFEEIPESLVNRNLYLYPIWANDDEISLILVYNGGHVDGEFIGGTVPDDTTCGMRIYSATKNYADYQANAPRFTRRISNAIEREGFRFIGWNTKADGSGVQYSEGSKLPEDAVKVFLYAQWEEIRTDDSGSSAGSNKGNTNPVTASKSKNGTVSILPKKAKKGNAVTITATPEHGYELNNITAKDADGNAVKLTNKGNDKYTFTMPASEVTVFAEFTEIQPETSFTDVPVDAYYADAVAWALENGITNGKTNSVFGSNDPCTRSQIVTFLWRAAGSLAPKGTAVVPTDVIPGSYYYDAVAWALENGITNGLSDGTFGGNNACTRGQSVTFLYRAAGKTPSIVNRFTDVEADSFCADAVAWAWENGVTNGTSSTTFSPDVGCTRSQIIAFLYRAYQKQ